MTIGEILNVKPYDWMIHEDDSKFKVTDGSDGSTVHETTDLTDALSAFDYCATEGGLTLVKRPKAATIRYPVSDTIEIGSGDYFVGVSGKMVTDVEVRPTTNTPAFTLTDGTLRASIEKILCTHDQSGYTKNLIHIEDSVREVMLSGLRFGGEGSGNFKGNAIGFELLTADKSQYEIKISDIICRDMENPFYFNIQQADSGSPSDFVSSIIFDSVFAWNCKRVALATGVSGGKLMALDFDKIHYQYSASNPLLTNGTEAVYDFSSVLSTWFTSLFQCMTWDIPAGSNWMNIGSSTEVLSVGSNLSHRVGGSGSYDKVKSFDWYNMAKGYFETNAVVGQRDYQITHNLGVAPREVYATILNQDINNQYACIVPKSGINTSTFFVRLVGGNVPIAPGTNNIKVSWRAIL